MYEYNTGGFKRWSVFQLHHETYNDKKTRTDIVVKEEDEKRELCACWMPTGTGGRFPYVNKYPIEFDYEFKERIRDKFNRKCFVCGMSEVENGKKLAVHHVDYNKDNMDETNFIPCCRRCHSVTNGNRDYWERTIKVMLLS